MRFGLVLPLVLALALLLPTRNDAEQQEQQQQGSLAGGDDDMTAFIGLDAQGNLHFNTTLPGASIRVNGKDLEAETSSLRSLLSMHVSLAADVDDALSDQEASLAAVASRQADLVSTLKAFQSCKSITFSEAKTVAANAELPYSVYAADFDGDGDVDVLSSSLTSSSLSWYKNLDRKGTFSEAIVIDSAINGAGLVIAADLDGDGDQDVLCPSSLSDRILWYENTDGRGTFSAPMVVSSDQDGAYTTFAADIDGDGDMDVVSPSLDDNTVAWHENVDGSGSFARYHVITSDAHTPRAVAAADLDGDGDLDVVSANSEADTVAWYENMDGNGTFSAGTIITANASSVFAVVVADVDGDGDIDVLSASYRDDKIAWYENLHGNGTFSEQKVITGSADGVYTIFAGDLDLDGDVDVLSGSAFDNTLAWFENDDGRGSFSKARVISTTSVGVFSVFAADVDGDGDLDVVAANSGGGAIAWHENLCIV